MKVVAVYSTSPEGRVALERATEEAHIRDAELHIVRVMTGAASENPSRVRERDNETRTAREDMDQLTNQLSTKGISVVGRVLAGDSESPTQPILEYLSAEGADVLVLGLRRRSPVGKLVLGSTAQDLLLGADCPVLAVKAPNR